MRRVRTILFCFVILGSSCSSSDANSELSGISFLRRCQLQASSFGFVHAGELQFEQFQMAFSDGKPENLSEDQASILEALTGPVQFGPTRFTPDRTVGTVVPGITSLDEFQRGVGLLEYTDFMRTVGFETDFDRASALSSQFTDPLLVACDSHEEEFLTQACAGGDSEACRLIENLDQLDPAIVAEACELTPYMLFCDPEDPIPWELPPLDDEG